jgi:hypothetical protein
MALGTPIGGIIVKGGKNPGGQMFVSNSYSSRSDGTYTFSGVPVNTGDYLLHISRYSGPRYKWHIP